MLEPTPSQREEINKLLEQMSEKLTALWLSGQAGFVTCHVGEDGGIVEANYKLPKVKRKDRQTDIAKRKGW